MAKKPTGITPEKLAELIARIEALPIVEPAIIPTKNAIIENNDAFRAAMQKGYSREQLVDMWNEYGSTIKEGTFAGYLREPNKTANITKRGKSTKQKGASSKKSETHAEIGKFAAKDNTAPSGKRNRSADRDEKLGTDVSNAETEQGEEAADTHTETDEDAMVDEIIAQRNAAKAAGSYDG